MMTTAETPTLTQLAVDLKTWVGTAFITDEDGYEVEKAILKLVRGKSDPENADDQYVLRVLQHHAILPIHVYTLLALLLRRRGGTVSDTNNSDDDKALLARAVSHLSGTPPYGLQRCMMCFTGLFSGDDMNSSDRLIGVRDVAAALFSMGPPARDVSVDLVQRIFSLVGDAGEEAGNVLGEVVEKMLQEMLASGNFGSMERALALEQSTSVMPTMDRIKIGDVFARTGLTARQFMWTYREVEKNVRFMDQARELEAELQKTLAELHHDTARQTLAEEIDKEFEEFVAHVERRVARVLDDKGKRQTAGAEAGEEDDGVLVEEADTEELVDAARAFEADKRWTKIPLNEVRFVPGVGGAATDGQGNDPVPEGTHEEGMREEGHVEVTGDPSQAAGRDERSDLDAGTPGGSSGQEVGSVGPPPEVIVADTSSKPGGAGEGVDVVMVDEGGSVSAAGDEQMGSGTGAVEAGGDDGARDAVTEADEFKELVPITQEELDDILRERYRLNRSHKPGKDGKDLFGKELAKDSKAHPGWKDAARQARDTWVRLEKALPGTYCLWKLGDTIGELVLRFNQKGSSDWSADTVYKNISAFLNSNLTDAEKTRYFGSVQTFKDCSLILKTAWKGVKKALADTMKNAEYSEKERHVPAWPVLFDLAQTYVDETAAPLTIETAEHAKLVRRLYGLRVSITEHVPRRREVFKVTPLRLTRLDPSHEDYVDPRKCNYVGDSGVLRLNAYKTADVYGEYALQLTPEAHALILLLEHYAERENEKTLFGNENNLSNLLYDIYEPVLHVRVGCGALRRRYISNAVREGRLKNQRDQVELSRKMGHSVWMQLFYYAKDESRIQRSASSRNEQAQEVLVVESQSEDEAGDLSSTSGLKRSADTDRSPPSKRVKQSPSVIQSAALREIIQREKAEGRDGSRISWKSYVPLYPVLQNVAGDTIRAWGKTERNKLEKKQSLQRE